MNITQPEIIIVAIITAFFSAVTGILTWLFGRRKSDAEIAEISGRVYNNLAKGMKSWVGDLEGRIEKQGTTIREQDEKIELLRVYVEQLERLLLTHNIIQRHELEEIREGIGL